jgi:hypothetical protein
MVETDPRLRITGGASVRDGQRRHQPFDEFVVISHASTIRRVLRTLQLGADRPTRRTTHRRRPGREGHPRMLSRPTSPGPAAGLWGEPTAGFEPATPCLPCTCSGLLSYVGVAAWYRLRYRNVTSSSV